VRQKQAEAMFAKKEWVERLSNGWVNEWKLIESEQRGLRRKLDEYKAFTDGLKARIEKVADEIRYLTQFQYGEQMSVESLTGGVSRTEYFSSAPITDVLQQIMEHLGLEIKPIFPDNKKFVLVGKNEANEQGAA